MQPAYYENLEEIQKKLWSMLDDAVINRASPFRIPVFICADTTARGCTRRVTHKFKRTTELLSAAL